MQTGISQLVLPQLSLEEFFAQAAAAGYEVVEVAMKREGELTPDTSAEDLKRIAELSRQAGLPMVSMTQNHCTGNLLASGESQQTAIEETQIGLRTAATLGIGCTLHTLGTLGPDICYDEAYRNGVTALKELAATAAEADVAIAVEFIWNGFLFSPLEMKGFLDEIGSPHIGFYFDPGNMAVFHHPHHWVRILGPHLKMAHMKDWQGRALKGGWTPLLEGEIDFAAVKRELVAAGYDGPMISEVATGLASLGDTAKAIRKIIEM